MAFGGDLLCDRVPADVLQGMVLISDNWCQGCYAAGILERGVSLTFYGHWELMPHT
jgi:hypothetical protein